MRAQLVNVKEKIKSALAITLISIVRHAFFSVLLVNIPYISIEIMLNFDPRAQSSCIDTVNISQNFDLSSIGASCLFPNLELQAVKDSKV